QCALRERAVADFAAPGTPEELHLTDRERWEVVVEHEPLVELAAHVLDLLLVVCSAERAGDQRLCLAAREDDRPVRPREHPGLAPDWPNLVELTAVEAHTALENLIAEDFLLELVEDALRRAAALGFFFGNGGDQLVEDGIDAGVVFQLVADPHRLGERQIGLLLD